MEYNTAIELNPQFPGGAEAALKWTEEALPKVTDEALASGASRLAETEEKSEEQRIEKARSSALQETVRVQKLGSLQQGQGKTFIFALLHASVIRRLVD